MSCGFSRIRRAYGLIFAALSWLLFPDPLLAQGEDTTVPQATETAPASSPVAPLSGAPQLKPVPAPSQPKQPASDAKPPPPSVGVPGGTASEAPPEPEARAPVSDVDPSALTEFRPTLDPYGRWIDDPRYGTVWVPNEAAVGPDFAPYVSSGHWALDGNDQWIWVSDYPFGWVVFHYGRWVYISGVGWSWVPGRAYAPSWVLWRVPTSSYAYVGWAPMPPAYGWFDGQVVWYLVPPPAAYVFCPSPYVFYPRVYVHLVHDRGMARRLGSATRPYRAPIWGRPYSPRYRRGPSPLFARIPASAVPAQRVAPDPHVMALERRSPSRTGPMFRSSEFSPGRQLFRARPEAGSARGLPARAPTRQSHQLKGRGLPAAPRSTRGWPARPAPGFRPAPLREPASPTMGGRRRGR